jgi:hypothetical protein
MNSHAYILSHFKGEKAQPCTFGKQTLPNCDIFGFVFTNNSNQVTAQGYYVELQVQNILGEQFSIINEADAKNQAKFGAFGNNLFDLLSLEDLVFTLNTTNSQKMRVLATDPIDGYVSFDYWPDNEPSAAQGPINAADASNSGINPMAQLHSVKGKVVTYTAAGMLTNGSCGVDSKGNKLPAKCGGFLQLADAPLTSVKTYQLDYLGSLYHTIAQATAQLKNSPAGTGKACPFTLSNGKPFPGCKYAILPATGPKNSKLYILYGAVAIQNGLGEVFGVVNAADFTNKTTQPIILNSFFNTLFGGLNAIETAANPQPKAARPAVARLSTPGSSGIDRMSLRHSRTRLSSLNHPIG